MKAFYMTACALICCMGNPAGIAGPICYGCSNSRETYQHIQRQLDMQHMQQRQQDMDWRMQQQQMERNYYRNY